MTSAVIMLALLCFIQLHRKSEPMVEVTFSGRNFVCHQLNATNSNNLECYLAARIRSLFLVFLTNPDDILSPLWFLLPFSCIKWHPKLSKARRAKLNGQALVISGCHLRFVGFFLNNLIWHPHKQKLAPTEVLTRPTFSFFFFNCNQWASSNTPISSPGRPHTRLNTNSNLAEAGPQLTQIHSKLLWVPSLSPLIQMELFLLGDSSSTQQMSQSWEHICQLRRHTQLMSRRRVTQIYQQPGTERKAEQLNL